MFAGYLQAAAYTNLNHVHGLQGWRQVPYTRDILTFLIRVDGFLSFVQLLQFL